MKIVSIALSKKKGTRKICVEQAQLIKDHGFKGDAHAGTWHRQISFLAAESINKTREQGLDVTFIATTGIDWKNVPVGSRVKIGKSAQVENSQIGKTCHKKCAIYYQAGDCIMPKEGVFARVLIGGEICCSDGVEFI
jgi:MOSC domain-containing protein YiiM